MKKNKTTARIPVQSRGIETKNSIIAAARELFEEKGYHGTNSKEIAGRAGLAVGTFYSYFDGKKPVFIEVIRLYYREISEAVLSEEAMNQILEPVKQKMDLKKMVRELIRAMYRAHTISPDLHREITAMIYSDSEIEKVASEEEEKTIGLVMTLLEMIPENSLRVKNIDAAVEAVFLSSEAVIHRLKMFNNKENHEELLEELEDMIYLYLFK